MKQKRCWDCGLTKQLADFYRDKNRPDGRSCQCRVCQAAYSRNRRLTDPEAARGPSRRYGAAHPEKASERSRRHYKAHRKERIEQKRQWRAANPDREAVIAQRRRARMAAVDNTLTSAEWNEILAKYDYRCVYCLIPFTAKQKATMDHVTPLSRGGTNRKENVVPACTSCNCRKSNKEPGTIGIAMHVPLVGIEQPR